MNIRMVSTPALQKDIIFVCWFILNGFTKRYHFCLMVYFEKFSDIKYAIHREKVLKGWCRYKKLELINSINPKWNDLSENWSDSD